MEKKDLVSILNKVLIPVRFKKKGNYWVLNEDQITKMVNLQKSQFGSQYYIDYGYILKEIPLKGMMHVYNRVTFLDEEERNKTTFLLDLKSNIIDVDRYKELKTILFSKLIKKLQNINTKEDLLKDLKTRLHLNDISLDVKNTLIY